MKNKAKKTSSGPSSRATGEGYYTEDMETKRRGSGFGGVNNVQVDGESFQCNLKVKGVELQYVYPEYFRKQLSTIPYEQLETYLHLISPIEDKQKSNIISDYRQNGNHVPVKKQKGKMDPNDRNINRVFDVIDAHHVVHEEYVIL